MRNSGKAMVTALRQFAVSNCASDTELAGTLKCFVPPRVSTKGSGM